MKKFLLLLLTLLSCTSAFSQTIEMKGRVVDANTGDGLAYASMIVVNKEISTYSDEKGYYKFKVQTSHLADTMLISNVGFQPTKVVLSSLANAEIKLVTEVYTLNEVSVASVKKKRKHTELNNLSNYLHSFYRFNGDILHKTYIDLRSDGDKKSDDLMRQYNNAYVWTRYGEIIGRYLPYEAKCDRYPYIYEVNTLISIRDQSLAQSLKKSSFIFQDQCVLRVRIFEVDQNNMPTKELLHENVLANVYDSQRVIFNLAKYNILIPKNGIFVGIEVIKTTGDILMTTVSTRGVFGWGYEMGVWHLFDRNLNDPAISITLMEP